MADIDNNQNLNGLKEPEPEVPDSKRADNKPQCFANQFRKTRMCRFHLANKCTRGANCTHAHDESELQYAPDLSKTSMCRDIVEKGECNRPNCNYAHHLSELKCSNTFFKTRYCRFFVETGQCKLGDKCRYAHRDSELRDSHEAKTDKPGFQKQVMHNEITELKEKAMPYTQPTAEEQTKQVQMQAEMMARQNIMASMMPPQGPAMPTMQPTGGDGKSHEEMASMFVAAAQAHLMEADRQKMRVVQQQQAPMGLLQPNAFAGMPGMPGMPTQQMMFDQSLYGQQMPYPGMTAAYAQPDVDMPRVASSSKMAREVSHKSVKELEKTLSSASLKNLEAAAAANLKGLGGSNASLKNLEAAARKLNKDKAKAAVCFGRELPSVNEDDDDDLWLNLSRNYVTKNTFIEVPDYEKMLAKETLKRVHMSAPMGLSAWNGGMSTALGGLFDGDSDYSDDNDSASGARDIKFDF